MPTSPSGGLLIFMNITIVIVVLCLRGLRRLGMKTTLLAKVFSPVIEKRFDGTVRKSFSYTVVMVVTLIIIATTTLTIERGVHNNSNYTVLSTLYNQGLLHETLANMRANFPDFTSENMDVSIEEMSDAEKSQFLQHTEFRQGVSNEESMTVLTPTIEELVTQPTI